MSSIVELAKHEELEGDLKEIYDLVTVKVRQIVSTGHFTADHIRPLSLNVIEIIQNYTKNKYDHIDGAQKKAMALNILRHVIINLRDNQQISQQECETLLLGLEFFGGALIDLGKEAYKMLIHVLDDVSEHGCSGCFGRNFKPRK